MLRLASSILILLLATSSPCKSFHRRFVPRRRGSATAARTADPLQPGTKKNPFYNWLDEIAFPAEMFPVSPLYLEPVMHLDEYLNTDKDMGCIMDDPARTMAHPIIDFDVEKASQLVIRCAQSEEFGRGKPVFAIARGSGGGKSRIEEEIRRNLLRVNDKVLPVAITFNGNSGISLDSWWMGMDEKREAYALSITARVASALFGVSFSATRKQMSSTMNSLDLSSTNYEDMLREMVEFFVRRVNDGRASLGGGEGEGEGEGETAAIVDTFVLLLDENRKVDAFANEIDMDRIVRAALMNTKLPGLNVAVVISDLGFLPDELRTGTDREVILLVPPPSPFP